MFEHLKIAFVLLCALAFTATVAGWTQSKRQGYACVVRTPGGNATGVAALRGGVALALTTLPFSGSVGADDREKPHAMIALSKENSENLAALFFSDANSKNFHWLGIRFGKGPLGVGSGAYQFQAVMAPWWAIASFFGLPVVRPIRSFWIKRRRRLMRQCVHCGYDLRASISQCPECGTSFLDRSVN